MTSPNTPQPPAAMPGATLVLVDPHQLAAALATRLGTAASDQRDDEWLDVVAAARHLCCLPSRIYDLKAAGRLRYAKEGTRLLFRRDWLDAALHIEPDPRS
jgi:hypothetical protein